MTSPGLPDRIVDRADLESLLALTTNWEEKRPRRPTPEAFRLDRVRHLLASIGNPQDGPAIVHVAGSKGKGSVVRMIDAALRADDRGPVGRYTSPHLEDLAERIAIDGRPATDDELAAAATALLPHVRRTRDTEHGVTFFELLTAIGWWVFREHGCREVVLETGLGGRLDATNVCVPRVALITSIEREHAEFLGSTVAAIAAEKAGILKSGVPAATCATDTALEVLRARAGELGVSLAVVGGADDEIHVRRAETGPGPRTDVELAFRDGPPSLLVSLPIAGAHHGANVALAAWAARRRGVADARIEEAFGRLSLPGVLEAMGGDPLVVADGAHTPASAEATRDAVERCWPDRRFVLLVALLAGKEAGPLVAALGRGAAAAVVTRLPTPRAQAPEDVAQAFRAGGVPRVEVLGEMADALERARALAGAGGLVLATGSVRVAGAIRTLCRD